MKPAKKKIQYLTAEDGNNLIDVVGSQFKKERTDTATNLANVRKELASKIDEIGTPDALFRSVLFTELTNDIASVRSYIDDFVHRKAVIVEGPAPDLLRKAVGND